MNRSSRVLSFITVLLLFAAWVTPASAQSPGADIVNSFDPSARGQGLGELRALNEGGPFAAWGNPAALATGRASSIGYSQTQIPLSLADDIWVRNAGASHRIGAFGVGVLYSQFSEGDQSVTDELGVTLRTVDSKQTKLGLAAGWSVLETLKPDTDPRHRRILVGASVSRVHDNFHDPFAFTSNSSLEVSAVTIDVGARFEMGFDVGTADPEGIDHITLGAAVSVDNVLGGEFDNSGVGGDPLEKWVHVGGMVRGEFLDHPRFGPLLRAEILAEHSFQAIGGDTYPDLDRFAFEAMIARLVSFRVAKFDAVFGELDGPTFGVGLSLDWTELPVGFRVDYARRPEGVNSGVVLSDREIWSLQISRAFH